MTKFLQCATISCLLPLFGCTGTGNNLSSNDQNTVVYGILEWTPKNLDESLFRNGDPIPEAKTDAQWKSAAVHGEPAWCYFGNDPINGKRYGKLYNWYAVNDPRGLAPEGWHIPTSEEWEQLVSSLNEEVAGTMLKSTTGWKEDGGGQDNIGFGSVPAGIRYHSGMFDDLGEYAHFWTSSEKERGWYGDRGSIDRYMSFREPTVGVHPMTGSRKGTGMSVRCVRRVLYEGYTVQPHGLPNRGNLLVDHELKGRSGHVGNAITECLNGDILAFYVNGSGVIWSGHGAAGWTEYKRSSDGGKTWSEPVEFEYSRKVWDENENVIEEHSFNNYHTAYVTSVVTAPNGNLIAFVSRRLPVLPRDKQGRPVYLVSMDHGHSWSKPRLVDENASFDDITLIHSDGGALVHEGKVYAVFLGGGASDYRQSKFSFYMSDNNGESFERISDDLFAGSSAGKHMCSGVLDDGSFIVYSFDPTDEHNLPYVLSHDQGYTWTEVKTTYMEKRMRNAQLSERIGDYYFMTGRSGNAGEDPSCLVLYASIDGIHWDRGVFLNRNQQGIDCYSALEVVGKHDPSRAERVLIQSSIGYSGLRNNISQWWIENKK